MRAFSTVAIVPDERNNGTAFVAALIQLHSVVCVQLGSTPEIWSGRDDGIVATRLN